MGVIPWTFIILYSTATFDSFMFLAPNSNMLLYPVDTFMHNAKMMLVFQKKSHYQISKMIYELTLLGYAFSMYMSMNPIVRDKLMS